MRLNSLHFLRRGNSNFSDWNFVLYSIVVTVFRIHQQISHFMNRKIMPVPCLCTAIVTSTGCFIFFLLYWPACGFCEGWLVHVCVCVGLSRRFKNQSASCSMNLPLLHIKAVTFGNKEQCYLVSEHNSKGIILTENMKVMWKLAFALANFSSLVSK